MGAHMNFLEFLSPSRLLEVVDIGANPIDGDPPYKPLLDRGLCNVTGFEPQGAALKSLLERKGSHETYLPYAIFDGQEATLRVCNASGMTSLLEPDPGHLALFSVLEPYARVEREVKIQTRRLDDVDEIAHLDFLKMDIQGGEHTVFVHGRQKLAMTVAIQVEVSFITLYKNQPSFGDIDLEMRAQGFIPHAFPAVKRWPIAPFVLNGNPRAPLNQLLEADVLYVRDYSKPERMSDDQLKHLALVAHACYGSFDLATYCIHQLVRRGVMDQSATGIYPRFLPRSKP